MFGICKKIRRYMAKRDARRRKAVAEASMKGEKAVLYKALTDRIEKSTEVVLPKRILHLLWRGYILSLSENSFLDLSGWYYLDMMLGKEGSSEVTEMIGGPISPEEWEELDRRDEEYAKTGVPLDLPDVSLTEDLRHRINVHLEMHDHSYTVVCLWKGFLAGVLETGIIDKESFEQLMAILPPGEEDQVMREIFKIE